MNEINQRDLVQSIERGFAVLLAFDEEMPTPTSAELAARTGLSRPAVRRILLTLQHLGYVRPEQGHWTLTPRVLTIGQHFAATHSIVEIAQPHLQRLAELTHESASLGQLDGPHVIYVGRVHVRRVMATSVDIGTRLPTHATAMGRVLLAWAEERAVEHALASVPLRQLTPRTVTDPVALRDLLHQVRIDGWAIVDSELEEGFLAAAVPVRDVQGEVVAALSHSTTRLRSSTKQIQTGVVPQLLEIAAAIEEDLSTLATAGRRVRPGDRDGFF
ncbi:IclR family transcriptional regulator domain-containing protein [Nocardioides daejeonensis]|uniref:IclR family transcriptional regulator domain-containing protein n=1 Tax=Nocardioides daejeonensis TaxID=1046556 RepID=UPI000D749C10|nr:IclR family transcriptional regulator C-terminal domain-containing protein [Nocardioides daejeonensis]